MTTKVDSLLMEGTQDYKTYDIYREVSSPTAMLSSLFGVVSHAAAKGLCVAQFDVKQAFTQTPKPKDHI